MFPLALYLLMSQDNYDMKGVDAKTDISIFYVLKVEINNDLEQITNLKVKTSEDVAGFYLNGFHHHLEKTGTYRRSKKHGKHQIGVYRFLHLHPSHIFTN